MSIRRPSKAQRGVARACVALGLAALGCGGNVELPPTSGPATGGASGAPAEAGADAVIALDADGAAGTGGTAQGSDSGLENPDEKFPWVCKDGGKDPYKSCCNGHVCLGTCESGSCHCGGMEGGCVLPSVCCNIGSEKEAQVVCGGYGVCLPWK